MEWYGVLAIIIGVIAAFGLVGGTMQWVRWLKERAVADTLPNYDVVQAY